MASKTLNRWLMTFGLTAVFLAWSPGLRAVEYITKDEFQNFLKEFEKFKVENKKFKAENEQLKTKNIQLTRDIEQIKASVMSKPIGRGYLVEERFNILRNDVSKVRSGTTKFLLGGFATAGYQDTAEKNSSFSSSFNPIFLWKLSDQISFESELEIGFQPAGGHMADPGGGSETDFELGYANLIYHFNDYLTFHAGKFLTPFGIFMERHHPSWINKVPNMPFVYAHGGAIVPATSVGAGFQGGFDAGPTKFNWSLYASNGPRLNVSEEASDFGALEFDNFAQDGNQGKAFGGRLGFLPIPELELGGSLQIARVGPQASNFSKVDSVIWGVDLSFTKEVAALMGTVDIRAEWVWQAVDDASFEVEMDPGPPPVLVDVDFNNNKHNGGYVQFAYRPTRFDHKWIKNLEGVFRYDRIDNPSAPHRMLKSMRMNRFTDRDRWSVGVNYWLGPSTVLKFAYQDDNRGRDAILMQFGIGF